VDETHRGWAGHLLEAGYDPHPLLFEVSKVVLGSFSLVALVILLSVIKQATSVVMIILAIVILR
jgi:hypothetical protein